MDGYIDREDELKKQVPLETPRRKGSDDVHTRAQRIARQVLAVPPAENEKKGRAENKSKDSIILQSEIIFIFGENLKQIIIGLVKYIIPFGFPQWQ